MLTVLDKLKECSRVVADTGDFEQLKLFHPHDATTNPSLLLQAAQMPQYRELLLRTVKQVTGTSSVKNKITLMDTLMDHVLVAFGCEILKLVPGVVSTEVDARLSFDSEASVAKARHLIQLYESSGYHRDRVLIKMATTWEGCMAAKVLQKEGINCNMTLVFSLAQAVAAAEASAFLISPFVGRILDWYKASDPAKDYSGTKDPGVMSVRRIYNYYKQYGYPTVIMGASFRNVEEVKCLAGCDRLTISTKLLDALSKEPASDGFTRALSPETAAKERSTQNKITLDEKTFRWMLNEDQMATEKLAEGIRNFHKDAEKLRDLIANLL